MLSPPSRMLRMMLLAPRHPAHAVMIPCAEMICALAEGAPAVRRRRQRRGPVRCRRGAERRPADGRPFGAGGDRRHGAPAGMRFTYWLLHHNTTLVDQPSSTARLRWAISAYSAEHSGRATGLPNAGNKSILYKGCHAEVLLPPYRVRKMICVRPRMHTHAPFCAVDYRAHAAQRRLRTVMILGRRRAAVVRCAKQEAGADIWMPPLPRRSRMRPYPGWATP